MFLPLPKAILQTIIYADVFDYPLKLEEIWKWLIGVRITNYELRIEDMKNIEEKDEYYFLKGRNRIVDLRENRKKFSEEKLKIAQDIGGLLKIIPTIKLVGITGALAVENAKKEDDIDLFIITSAGLLWTARLLATLLIEITGLRRHPAESSVNNKICLNMFVDENNLAIPEKEQDLFSAHEVVQMRVLWDRRKTYLKFLVANQWARKYLPNAIKSIKYKVSSIKYKVKRENLLENILRKFQLWYMKNRRTTEVIRDGIIRFHPHDAREWVMRKYKKRVRLLSAI